MKFRFERQFEKEFETESQAFEYACGWHDERDAIVEKLIDGEWYEYADFGINFPHLAHKYPDGAWYKRGELISGEPRLLEKNEFDQIQYLFNFYDSLRSA